MYTSMTGMYTPAWTAPEVLRASSASECEKAYTFSADVYSFGMVLYALCTRQEPFRGMQSYHITLGVATQNLRPAIPPSVPQALAAVIEKCWNEDPLRRPSFIELIALIEGVAFPTPKALYPAIKKSHRNVMAEDMVSESASSTRLTTTKTLKDQKLSRQDDNYLQEELDLENEPQETNTSGRESSEENEDALAEPNISNSSPPQSDELIFDGRETPLLYEVLNQAHKSRPTSQANSVRNSIL